MFLQRRSPFALVFIWCFLAAALSSLAQQQQPTPPAPEPTPQQQQQPADAQEDVQKVYTEEVRIPIFVTDEQGRFDPALEIPDVLVLENDVPQEIRSVRRIPASVMLVVGTGGDLNPSIRTTLTRTITRHLVSKLRAGDHISVLQFAARTEWLQDWTTEKELVDAALRSRLSSGKGSRLSQAIIEAAARFNSQPVGNRHLVLITDGVEMPGGRLDYKEAIRVLNAGTDTQEGKAQAAEAIRQLNAAHATVHIISYTSIGRKEMREEAKRKSEVVGMAQSRADMTTVGIDPTRPMGMRGAGINPPQANGQITFDPQMRRLRKAYEQATKRSEQRLTSFAEETGGRIWLPLSNTEMIAHGEEVAREIGSQYVITYAPKRPLATAPPNEYRRIVVAPRRIGLRLRARRGYVVSAVR